MPSHRRINAHWPSLPSLWSFTYLPPRDSISSDRVNHFGFYMWVHSADGGDSVLEVIIWGGLEGDRAGLCHAIADGHILHVHLVYDLHSDRHQGSVMLLTARYLILMNILCEMVAEKSNTKSAKMKADVAVWQKLLQPALGVCFRQSELPPCV